MGRDHCTLGDPLDPVVLALDPMVLIVDPVDPVVPMVDPVDFS